VARLAVAALVAFEINILKGGSMASLVPVVAESEEPDPDDVAVVGIDLDEFEDDRRDPEWQAFLKRAKVYRQRLRLEGRIR
jgi:hypothetical protein